VIESTDSLPLLWLSMSPTLLCTSLVLLLCLGGRAAGHDGFDAKLANLTESLAEAGPDADLYLSRAELQRRHGHFAQAFTDLNEVARLAPDHAGLPLARARLLLDVRWFPAALGALAEHLERVPEDVDGLQLLADVHRARGALRETLAVHTRLAAAVVAPTPQSVLSHAQAVLDVSPEDRSAARTVLDLGMGRLGPLASLQLRAIQLELEDERWDAALQRLESLAAQSPRQERWLVERGDILVRAGHVQSATDAYRAALSAIGQLKPHRRRTALVVDLRSRAEAQLVELSAKPGTPIPLMKSVVPVPDSQPDSTALPASSAPKAP
jgi:predicted Zn-dependent protease